MKLNRDTIKYFAIFTMTLNHIAYIFLKPGTMLRSILIIIGYFTAVTMCWFLTEGYYYTRSRKKYGTRLAVFALLSQLPFNFALSHGHNIQFTGMNMIFTLFLCFLILCTVNSALQPGLRTSIVFFLVILSDFSDWGILAPVFTLIFAYSRLGRFTTARAYTACTAFFFLFTFFDFLRSQPVLPSLILSFFTSIPIAVSGIVILFFYNGKRASRGQAVSKWFFYLYYPLHLLLLGLLRLSIGM